MKKSILYILLFTFIISVFHTKAQDTRNTPLVISKEETLKGMKKEKIFSKAKRWLKSDDENIIILRFSEERGVIEAQSIMPYVNNVSIEDVFLSPDAALRTKGTIKFLIRVTCEDEKILVEFTDFVHEAYESRYGKISFGTIVKNDKVPLGKCFEHTTWCNAVWEDMRVKIRKQAAKMWLEAKEVLD